VACSRPLPTRGKQPSVAIVTAWQNHPELAPDYFNAVETANPDQLVIVDDGSDEPLEFAATRLDTPAGFCGANNAGLTLVETDYVVMLNNDVAMLRPTWLEEILAHVEPGVVCGPLRFDPHGNVDDIPYPYVDGWCLAMLTDDMRALGGWDEAYDDAGPAYFSDNAFAFQARLAGLRLREVRPGLQHKGGQTGGVDHARFEAALRANELLFKRQVREALTVAA
jgi:GT2 family glycosyltransferase